MKTLARKGFTLIEVMVACVILVTIFVTCAAIVISTYSSFPRDKAKYLIAQEANNLKEELKIYVTDDLSVTANAPGNPPWHLPDDTSCATCWALNEGKHDVTGRLPESIRETYKATMSYSVTVKQYQGRDVRDVTISVDWTPPKS